MGPAHSVLQDDPARVPVTVSVPDERRTFTVVVVDVPVRRFTPLQAGTIARVDAWTPAGSAAAAATSTATRSAATRAAGSGVRVAGRPPLWARTDADGTGSSIDAAKRGRSRDSCPRPNRATPDPTRKDYAGRTRSWGGASGDRPPVPGPGGRSRVAPPGPATRHPAPGGPIRGGRTTPALDRTDGDAAQYGSPVDRRRWLVLSAVSVGTFMATLDGSIVNIALPSIRQAFGIDLATVEWVVVAYLLVVGSLLLPFGRLGEVLSFRRVYLAGFAVFTVGQRPLRRGARARRARSRPGPSRASGRR